MSKEKKSIKNKKSGKIAVVVSRFNNEVTSGLLSGAVKVLRNAGYEVKDYKIFEVPGAFEIPLTAKQLCESGKYCGIISLGAVIKGDTAHFEYISSAVTTGIANLTLEYSIPISFGVITTYTDEQAIARSRDDEHNKGAEAAKSTLEMIELLKSI